MITIPFFLVFLLLGWFYPSTPTAYDIAKEIERQRLAREAMQEAARDALRSPVDEIVRKRVEDRAKLASDRAKK